MSFNKIPIEMRAWRQWVTWRYEINVDDPDGKPRKVPYNPRTANRASVTDHSTFSSFEEVCKACSFTNATVVHPDSLPVDTGYAGIGFVLTRLDPYCFVDLDDAHGDEVVFNRQSRIFIELDSYSERSPSGTGLHIICKAGIERGRRRSFIELYSCDRYMTMTGDVYRDEPIQERQHMITQLYNQLGGGVALSYYDGNAEQTEEDEALIEKAKNAQNGAKFTDLWEGNWQQHYGPHKGHQGDGRSEAEFALVDILAFYTQNRAQIRRLFLASQFKREKHFKHRRYIDYMINKSFDRMLPPVDIEGMKEQLEMQITESVSKALALEMAIEVKPEQPTLPIPGFDFDRETQQSEFMNVVPGGLVGKIAKFIYDTSPSPIPEIALAGALGLMAGITGRAWNVSGGGLNQYILLLASTGAGKEAISSGISRLMSEVKKQVPLSPRFVGPTVISSGQALIRHLSKSSQCFVSIVSEFALLLQTLNSKNPQSSNIMLRRMMLELYHKSGHGNSFLPTIYSDTDKNIEAIAEPAFSLLGETVPETFYQNLDESMICNGFLPRFTIIEYKGSVPEIDMDHHMRGVPMSLIDEVSKLCAHALQIEHAGKVINVEQTPDAKKFLTSYSNYARSKLNAVNREVIRNLWNRAHIKAMRLAAVVAVGIDWYEPVITLEIAQWAHALVNKDVLSLIKRFESGDFGEEQGESKQLSDMKRVFRDYINKPFVDVKKYAVDGKMHAKHVVPLAYVQRRCSPLNSFRKDLRGETVAIKRTVINLIETGIIREVSAGDMLKDYGATQRAFVVNNWDKLNEDD